MEKITASQAIADLGLTVESRFVPFSQSRNNGEKNFSLNWIVTVKRNGRDVLSTDYMAGMGHCPGYNAAKKAPDTFRARGYKTHDGKPYPGTTSAYRSAKPHEALQQFRNEWCNAECESGFRMEWNRLRGEFTKARERQADKLAFVPILPDAVSLFYSLAMDSSVLDMGGFENWAAEYGYDTDSRKAETIYSACLDIALKLRAAIGESGMETLKTAFEDF